MERQGATGALLDIYQTAITALQEVIKDISDDQLCVITDAQTTDENCRSVQTILAHVVSAGNGYATSIYHLKGYPVRRPDKVFRLTIEEYMADLTSVFAYTARVFKEIEDAELEQPDNALKMKTTWGQLYDIEQLTEHAIVHILRHKRQIEKIKDHLTGPQASS